MDHYDPVMGRVFRDASTAVKNQGRKAILIEDILLAAMDDSSSHSLFRYFKVDTASMRRELAGFLNVIKRRSDLLELAAPEVMNYDPEAGVYVKSDLLNLLKEAQDLARDEFKRKEADARELILAMLARKSTPTTAVIQLLHRGLTYDRVHDYLKGMMPGQNRDRDSDVAMLERRQPGMHQPVVPPLESSVRTVVDYKKGKTGPVIHMGGRALQDYARNLNQSAIDNQIDPLIGREQEVERVIQTLCRRRKNNPLLVGEPGVGKTAIAEGLALRIIKGGDDLPDDLRDANVFALDMGALVAGTKWRGEFEERIKEVLKDLEDVPNAILFIDEVHTLVGAGSASGSMDAANMLKPVLAKGGMRCIGATTYDEYRKYFEKDAALSRRFQKIDVAEPSVDDTVKILRGLRKHYEDHHRVSYTDEALQAAAEMASRYINDRFMPDKAIDVIDEAGAAVHINKPAAGEKPTIIDRVDVERVVARMAHIPEANVSTDERTKLRDLGTRLKNKVYEQDLAIDALHAAIKTSRAGLGNPEKPYGSFLFSGPTGVGKTEVARQLAHVLGVELIRFDMSEYMEKHSVSRLIGSPPGYVGFDQGGLLTEAVTRNPHAVLLLDEIEKAHPDIFNILLQVMDHGTLTDNNGRKADFRNVVIIMTTNAGAAERSKAGIGFSAASAGNKDSKEEIRKVFTPEFRNRLDAIIDFASLSQNGIQRVAKKFLDELRALLSEKEVVMEEEPAVVEYLAREGFDPVMGARPMERVIQEKIKKPLADELLFGALTEGGHVSVGFQETANDDGNREPLSFVFTAAAKNRRTKDPKKGSAPKEPAIA